MSSLLEWSLHEPLLCSLPELPVVPVVGIDTICPSLNQVWPWQQETILNLLHGIHRYILILALTLGQQTK